MKKMFLSCLKGTNLKTPVFEARPPSRVTIVAPSPPSCDLEDITVRRMTLKARESPNGLCIHRQHIALLDFERPWTTAFVVIRDVPSTLVCPLVDAVAYIHVLHRLMVQTYVFHDVPLPPWRSWDTLTTAWPFLREYAALFSAHPSLPRIRVVRPLH